MYDDLAELDKVDVSDIRNNVNTSGYPKQNYQKGNESGGYQKGNGGGYNNGGGGYQKGNSGGGGYQKGNGGGGGGGNFYPKKEEVLEEPYIPIAIYVDRDFPEEVKTSLFHIASKLIAKKITVRYNGDDKDFHEKLSSLSSKYVEVYIPWRNFNEVDSKHYYNTLTSKHLAQQHFSGWDKIPDSVKALLARNVRMIFGDKNNSVALCLVTWSQDGAARVAELTKDTGRSSTIIRVASTYGFPVLNIAKEHSGNILEKTFGI